MVSLGLRHIWRWGSCLSRMAALQAIERRGAGSDNDQRMGGPTMTQKERSMTDSNKPAASPADHVFDDAFSAPIDPFAVFETWFEEAAAHELNEPNAMALATVDADGMPDARMVLLNGRDHRGFVFFTNSGSAKGIELAHNPRAALLFHWKSIRRQIRIRGTVEPVSDAEADAYFATRAPQSRRGAHASRQSRPLASRAALEAEAAGIALRYPDDDAIPRPDFWNGYRVVPSRIEFWQDGAYRLHNRMLFIREQDGWTRTRLYP